MKTYDIYFTDGESTDHKGFFLKTEDKAIHMAEDMLKKGNSWEIVKTESGNCGNSSVGRA